MSGCYLAGLLLFVITCSLAFDLQSLLPYLCYLVLPFFLTLLPCCLVIYLLSCPLLPCSSCLVIAALTLLDALIAFPSILSVLANLSLLSCPR
jgi:hypothetical protein